MPASELIPHINQVSNVLEMSELTRAEIIEKNRLLQQLADDLVKAPLTADAAALLASIANQLQSMIGQAPGRGMQSDTVTSELRSIASGFHLEEGDPELDFVWEQLKYVREQARAIREDMHQVNEGLPRLDELRSRLTRTLSHAEEDFISTHLLSRDKLGLLSLNSWTVFENLLLQLDVLLIKFEKTITPADLVQFKNDVLPFALLPVRVETRFMVIKHVRNNKIFTSVDDAFRSNEDVIHATSLDRNDAVALESVDPRGGASFVLQPPEPMEMVADKHELWVRIYPDDIAIHTHETPLTNDEIAAGKVYWDEMWLAGNSVDAELGAWRVLAAGYGAERAAWIAKEMTPNNVTPDRPTGPQPVTVVNPPQFPSPTPKPAAWSAMPHSKVMPERFVVRLYDANGGWREVLGRPVPDPLPVGVDPSGSHDAYLDQSVSGLNMPPDIRWIVDFEEAEAVGMGIRVTLQPGEEQSGFERLLVLGLKLNPTVAQNVDLLEELFDNHHYKAGLALVPQGTATNNTDGDKSGYASYDPGKEISFATERRGDLFTPMPNNHYEKTDGERLADALGISTDVFQNVLHSNRYDGKESIAMNRALWSATLGYYMKHLLSPATLPADVANTRAFFTKYVHGRGLVPAFRVRNQPYGVLPTTVYSRWTYNDPLSFEANMNKKVLQPLNAIFGDLSLGVSHVVNGTTTNANTLLADILGLHPASVSFKQRVTCGAVMLWNIHTFVAAGNKPSAGISAGFYDPTVIQALDTLYRTTLNFSYLSIPRILGMNFSKDTRTLNGPVIDLLPLSETNTVQPIGNTSYNYINWLLVSSLRAIREENFQNIGASPTQPPPRALLYLLLRHALFLEHLDAAQCLLAAHNVVTSDVWMNHELINVKRQPNGTPAVSQEQRDMLFGVVRAEVLHDHDLVIQNQLQNLASDPFYQSSGMTPEQYEQYLWDQSAPHVEHQSQMNYATRLEAYHVDQAQWNQLTNTFPVISAWSMEEYLYRDESAGPCTMQLNEVRNALALLQTLPTARLERCLAEHIDTCSYRFDSWMTAMVTKRLEEQRTANAQGMYIGAYGILERVKPGTFPGIYVVNLSDTNPSNTWESVAAKLGARKELLITPYGNLPQDPDGDGQYQSFIDVQQYQPATFIYLGGDRSTELVEDRRTGRIYAPPRVDSNNNGYILAPSLTHAVTAAILRAGYKAHENTGSPYDALAVNLSSSRVRKALFYIEGIRNGQTLGALLGYQFERALHDYYSGAASPPPLDSYLYDIRQKFPLVADAQARQVTDGLQLIEAYRAGGWSTGITIPSGDLTIIEGEIVNIINAMDAVGDLLLSESVYQVARGNFKRSGATLKALTEGGVVPEPEITSTPRINNVLTNRCMVQMLPAATPANTWTGTSLRAQTEPALNKWLISQLPPQASIKIAVSYLVSNVTTWTAVSIADLALQPLDLVMLFNAPGSDEQQDDWELSRRVRFYQHTVLGDERAITVDYRNRGPLLAAERTIFELNPMLRSLVQLINKSRALTAEDFVLPNEASGYINGQQPGGPVSAPLYTRLTQATTAAVSLNLSDVKNTLGTAITNASHPALNYTSGTPVGALAVLNTLRTAIRNAARFGITNSIPETVTTDSLAARNDLVAQGTRVKNEIDYRYGQASTRLNTSYANYSATITTERARVQDLSQIAQIVFGGAFKVLPEFTLYNANDVTGSLGLSNLLSTAGDFAVDEWMQGTARVRPQMGNYRKQMILSESVAVRPFTEHSVIQLPHDGSGNARWVGMELPANYVMPPDNLSIVLENNMAPGTGQIAGMVVDEWVEHVPVKNITTGIAMHYDQPNNEAPQSILLAVTPEITGSWSWNDLMDTLNETIGMAMKRAVEPDAIQTCSQQLSQVLPAIVVPMTGGTDTSPSLDFARNIVNVTSGYNPPIDTTAFVAGKPMNKKDLNINNTPSN